MSETLEQQRIEHETKVYRDQTVHLKENYGTWTIERKRHRVYPLGDNNWTTNIQLAMIQQRAEMEREKHKCSPQSYFLHS